jgi:hypothetical protein
MWALTAQGPFRLLPLNRSSGYATSFSSAGAECWAERNCTRYAWTSVLMR